MTPTHLVAARETYRRIATNISKIIRGQDSAIKHLLAALAAGGHVLLEDVPGIGKTLVAKALARSLRGSFKRIQATHCNLRPCVVGHDDELVHINQRAGGR